MLSICLHGIISWSQASGRGRLGPIKTVIAEKYHPSVLKFCLTSMDCIQYFKQNDQVLWRCLFIWACEGLSIPQALHIDVYVWEMAGFTAMAVGGEQTQSAHACDVSLGARITTHRAHDAMISLLRQNKTTLQQHFGVIMMSWLCCMSAGSPCQTDPPYHWVCDPSRHCFVETFTSLAFTSLSNDLPTAIKLVLSVSVK